MDNKNKKTKIYFLILVAMIITAIVISVNRKIKESSQKINDLESNLIEQQEQNSGPILGNKEDLVFFSVSPFSEVKGILSYRGKIKGGYFFEGNILINILDSNKKLLKSSNGIAEDDWMTSDAVSFEGNIDFTDLPLGQAYFEIHNDNASGLSENDKSILIPIIIN